MQSEASRSTYSKSHLKHCFILGIKQRSGTNYLFRLLGLHPDCEPVGTILEDLLTHHSDLLVSFVNSVYGQWDPSWEVEKTIGPPDMLLSYFGDALIRFLNLQVTRKLANTTESDRESSLNSQPKCLLTKTPSVVGLENFFKLFPNAHLLIIIRDGRAVVESGVRSFDWDYEQAIRDWAAAAHTIIQFKQNGYNAKHKYLIVKYEDLFSNTEQELRKVLSFLSLDSEVYDFDAATSLGVIGSSELRRTETDKLHWRPVEKTPRFDPLMRWSHWSRAQHRRFNWIAGDYLSFFGYTPDMQRANRYLHIAWNTMLDLRWEVRTGLRWIIGKTRKIN